MDLFKSTTRIVSLLPSATEIICALGARDSLVGISHECDYPPGVEGLPRLTRPRYEIPGSSAGIDGAVRSVLESALSIYEIDLSLLRELQPDIVFTQDLCNVCAPSLDDVKSAVRDWCGPDTQLVSQSPQSMDDVTADILIAGHVLGLDDEARALASEMLDVMLEIHMKWRESNRLRQQVLTIEWINPLMPGGLWMAELVEAAGGNPLLTERARRSRPVSDRELLSVRPDVVLVKPCGFDLSRGLQEWDVLLRQLPDDWPAVANRRIWFCDGSQYFNRPGPRLLESLEILAFVVNEDLFPGIDRKYAGQLERLEWQGQ